MTNGPGELVRRFYQALWNARDETAAPGLLASDFVFRGSLGAESIGIPPFLDYLRGVHAALGDYHCEILELIARDDRAAAKMRFSGRHRGVFLGYPPTGAMIDWLGAAFFRTRQGRIGELWVLGDLAALERRLEERRGT